MTFFRPYLRKFILVFFDDILVYNKNWEDHLSHLQAVFLKFYNITSCLSRNKKCAFGQSRVEYLGHIISSQGVEADP